MKRLTLRIDEYTYNKLSMLAMRKSIDSAPSSTVNELIKWARSNNIKYESNKRNYINWIFDYSMFKYI